MTGCFVPSRQVVNDGIAATLAVIASAAALFREVTIEFHFNPYRPSGKDVWWVCARRGQEISHE
jgi:hypothetical protein